jgi:tRNA-intron endonuclease, archaea type
MFKEGYLLQDKVIIEDATLKGFLVEKGFGESKGRNLILDLYEAVYLVARDKLIVKAGKRKVKARELIEIGLKGDKTFYSKAIVYEDIKEKGYQIKTGLKFGFDFRIYPKGKKMGQAHSQFGLNVFTENKKISMTQISRITRLAGNIHITAINAVVDRENEINYYSMKRQLF